MLKSFDMSAEIAKIASREVKELTFTELVRAYSAQAQDETDLRVRKWLPAFGHLSAWSITADQMAAGHQAMINSGYSVASANRDLSAIGTIYRWAINGAKCSPAGFASPTVGVRRARESERIVEVDDEVIDQLRARSLAFKDRRFGLFVALLCDTGARKSEILERRWSDFLLDQRQIVVQLTKNGKPKILYFSEETLSLLKRVAPTRQPERLVFEGRIPDSPIDYRKSWFRAIRDVELQGFHVHDVRHFKAAHLLRSGQSIAVSAQILGHSPAVLAKRYGHLETRFLQEAQEKSWKSA